jgi:purine nucleoside phosphorylase
VPEPAVWVFFYGSYINMDVLREAQYSPARCEVARLAGFDICIRPRANLFRSTQHCVYGILATGAHAELSRLYAHAKDVLGETYLPEAVLAETLEGSWKPALCYVCPAMVPRPATNDYIDRIVTPARKYGFPTWYLERLESFRPKS